MPKATVRANDTVLPTVIASIGDQGQRVEYGFRWPPEAAAPTPRPALLEVVVDRLGTLSASAMLLAVGFVCGAMWRGGL
jgi:hypothetical protein